MDDECSCCGLLNGSKQLPRKVPVRVEPKTYFANERTFLSWINMSVTLGSISSALTVFGDNETASGAGTQLMSLLLTLVATFFVGYAMYTFHIRRAAIKKREDAGLNQVVVPILIASTLVLSLIGVLISNIAAMNPAVKPAPQIPEEFTVTSSSLPFANPLLENPRATSKIGASLFILEDVEIK